MFLKLLRIPRAPKLPKLARTLSMLQRAYLPATPVKKRRPTASPIKARKSSPAFTQKYFTLDGTRRSFRLYRPPEKAGAAAGAAPERLPVIVMLHGCKQDATDFAAGTRMNDVGEKERFIVVYPEQVLKANSMRCWNWFEPRNQGRGGEAAVIAALARHVVKSEDADPSRVYIAGLSAGGAMALVVANQFPEVFAAVGVHSGLPEGAASNVISALHAMRSGPGPLRSRSEQTAAVPTIVFQGTDDRTVHPRNGEAIVSDALRGFSDMKLEKSESAASGKTRARNARREVHHDADGRAWIESWVIEAAPHAWSGGAQEGSYTDPAGPDASKAMASFFLQHRLSQG